MNEKTIPIYLQIHYSETRKRIQEYIKNYNDSLEKEWKEDPEAFKEKHIPVVLGKKMLAYWLLDDGAFVRKHHTKAYEKAKEKVTLKACVVKPGIDRTIFCILNAFAKHLQNNQNAGIIDPVFKINNSAIATKTRISNTSAWRHRTIATRCGILDGDAYTWHGSNSSFQIAFNPAVLVADFNKEYFDISVKMLTSVHNLSISDEKRLELIKQRPSFSDAPNGCMISFCNHIVLEHLLEQNINMEKGVDVENLFLLPQKNLSTTNDFKDFVPKSPEHLPEQGSIRPASVKGSNSAGAGRAGAENREKKLGGVLREKVAANADNDLFEMYVSNSLSLALRVLYKNRTVTDWDIATAKQHISEYFRKKDKKLIELSRDFDLVIFEARKSIYRKGFTPRPLYQYFDSGLKYGFYYTLEHVNKIVKPYLKKQEEKKQIGFNPFQKDNKIHSEEITKSINQTMSLYNLYLKNPNDYEVYRKATQVLGKKRNKQYLEFFNEAIASPETLNNQAIQQYFHKLNN